MFCRLENEENVPPGSSQPSSDNTAPVILITGIPKSKAEKIKTDIQKLGGHVVSAARTCTHLVSNRVSRTVKFLTGLSVAKYVVTPQWLEACVKEEKFVGKFCCFCFVEVDGKLPQYYLQYLLAWFCTCYQPQAIFTQALHRFYHIVVMDRWLYQDHYP